MQKYLMLGAISLLSLFSTAYASNETLIACPAADQMSYDADVGVLVSNDHQWVSPENIPFSDNPKRGFVSVSIRNNHFFGCLYYYGSFEIPVYNQSKGLNSFSCATGIGSAWTGTFGQKDASATCSGDPEQCYLLASSCSSLSTSTK